MNEQSLVLVAHDVSKVFTDAGRPVQVLKQLNFSLQAGEQVAIIGPSGSGKSTFLQILAGLDDPSSGELLLQEQSMATMSEAARCRWRQKHLGFVYQSDHLLPEFNALENVALPLLLDSGVSTKQAQQRAKSQLQAVGLGDRSEHRLSQLSGGERQRVAIARALINRPACILADEPTGNLDAETAEQVYQTLLSLNRAEQTSLVIVTHDLQLAAKMDRILALQAGQLVAVASEA